MGFSSFSQVELEEELSFTARNMQLSRALDKLSEKAKISIAYSQDLLSDTGPITIRFKKEKFQTILEYLLNNSGLQYKVIGNQVVLFRGKLTKKEFTISGYVEDEASGERLIGANVIDPISKKGTSTNAYGFYSLTLTEGLVSLNFSYLGFQIETRNFDHHKNQQLNINLTSSLILNEITVLATTDSINQRDNDYSTLRLEELPVHNMFLSPSLAGETDLIRLAHMTPGVQTGADGLGGIHVRGGGADQTLFLLDGVPVYNASHLAGILSIYNSDAIRSAELSKSSFPTRYGGRLSSVMDVRTKEGNNKELRANVGVGLTAIRATLEGPIKKDKAAFFISGRRALLDFYVKPITTRLKEDRDEKGFSDYNFYDWNAKVNYKFSNRDKLYLSFYNGSDDFYDETQTVFVDDGGIASIRFEDKIEQELKWGNTIGALRWNHLFGNKLFSNTTLTYSQYKFRSEDQRENLNIKIASNNTEDTLRKVAYSLYQSEIQDWAAKTDFDFIPNAFQYWRFGFEGVRHTFNPGVLNTEDNAFFPDFGSDTDSLFQNSKIRTNEYTLYVEQEWQPNTNLKTVLGLRGTLFNTGEHNYWRLEPRVNLSYLMPSNWRLHGGWSLVYQYLHLLTASGIGLPNDLWLPSTQNIAPQRSWQATLGVDRRIYEKMTVGAELYYKKMDHLISYREGGNLELVDADNWEDKVTSGEGWSYGAEFYLQKNIGKTTGAFGYTLSWAKRQFEAINFGLVYPFRYDRRHSIQLSCIHQFNKRLSVSGNWVYGSGVVATLPLSEYEFPVDPFLPVAARVYSERNSVRMPAYHRMDVGMVLQTNRKWGKDQFSLGIYNVYNRKNPIYYRVGRDPDDFNKKQYLQATLFHVTPYFSYKCFF